MKVTKATEVHGCMGTYMRKTFSTIQIHVTMRYKEQLPEKANLSNKVVGATLGGDFFSVNRTIDRSPQGNVIIFRT